MNMSTEITIVIADDHPLVRMGLRQVIEQEEGLRVVGEAGDGKTAYELIASLTPRVALLDLEMPQMNGLDVTQRVEREHIKTSVIILTVYDEEELFQEAMEKGALGYILKDSATMDVVRAIQKVCRGEYFISPSLSNYALKKTRASGLVANESRTGLLKLSPSERRILKLVAEDKSSSEIADILSISQRTVDNHRTHICRKLGLTGINSLLRFALLHRHEL